MAIYSFLSVRKRPVVVVAAVTLFIVVSSLFLLFSPAPTALPFFSSSSSHLSSQASIAAVSSNAFPPETPTSVVSNWVSSNTSADRVSADASPPVVGTAIASDAVSNSTADPPRPDTTAAAGDAKADVSQPDHGMPPAATEASGSAGNGETAAGVSSERDEEGQGGGGAVEELPSWELCKVGKGVAAADYIPCLDNVKAVKALKSLRHMEHRERHCPTDPRPRCLVPLPERYRRPVPWPRSRDMVRTPALLASSRKIFSLIWYNNVPHPKLVEYKKDQNWVRKSGNYFVFPGGGTQFKNGVASYIKFIEQILPNIQWGIHTRTVLDVGCGVASFGGYLLDRNVITMSVAPKDEHEAQIQFALERGIPAFLAVIGTQKLPFPDNSFDVIHCARCRVHWYADGGKPLLELNRVLRPGGYYIWSATPVYRKNPRDIDDWNAVVALTKSICWRTVVRSRDINKIGVVIYQKPTSNSCSLERKNNEPPLCSESDGSRFPWYIFLNCLNQWLHQWSIVKAIMICAILGLGY
ncbi:putative methyltransferase PMT23 [Zea mays]|uniref:Methyltransferase n=1 Tax=Zea mays TaxID=4577 RepID=A0A1D6N807_MAIZE|nr:putative methyltransferase PMT23 [Zea mays]ONM36726.1 putative methyltransferase PMT23 [Zea mays]